MFPAELFRVVVAILQHGAQWDNYPNDFNISKNCITLIINLRTDVYLEEIGLLNERIINMVTKSMGDIMVLYPIITQIC